MRVPGREELAWAAGIFCGEGSTSLHKPRRFIGLRLTVGQAGVDSEPPEMLTRFHAIFREGSITRVAAAGRQKAHYKAQWQYCARRFVEAQAMLAMMWPWLTQDKREQAAAALGAYHAHRATMETRNYALRQREAA